MDAGTEQVLQRMQYGYWTLWCRKFGYRSYRNVYGVYMTREGDKFSQEVHRVYGTLGNGSRFGGFLIRSQVRKNAYAALSDAFCIGLKSKEKRGGHWVIVEAESPDAALAHQDVADVRDELMQSGPTHLFCGVYFISNSRGAVKIGNTASSIMQRLCTLQSGSAYPLRLVALIHTTSHKKLEAELHKKFKALRLEGEWFQMTEEEAIQVAKDHGGSAVTKRSPRSTLMPKCRA